MQTPLDIDEVIGAPYVSTGHLPPAERADTLLAEASERFKLNDDGKVADYIPALARTPRNLFGLCQREQKYGRRSRERYGVGVCKAAGFTGPLDQCSIYGNKAAGDRLNKMLSMGVSKPWPTIARSISSVRGSLAGGIRSAPPSSARTSRRRT